MKRKTVVLLSGGMDSATCLALAKHQGADVVAVSFEYGQRHLAELDAARRLANHYQIARHYVLTLPTLGGSSLTDKTKDVARNRAVDEMAANVPSTYVPARNLVFLSHALGVAEIEGADEIAVGVNALDFSGYPDCRPAFVQSFERTANLATKAGALDGQPLRIWAPLIDKTKAEIVRLATSLGVPLRLTVSCYTPTAGGNACGTCDACILRKQGFLAANIADVTRYSA